MSVYSDLERRAIGDRIGPFVVDEALESNVAPVYRCHDAAGHPVAVKVIDIAAACMRVCGMPVPADRLAHHRATLRDEVARIADLRHDHLASVVAADDTFVALEWQSGMSLDALLARRGPLPFAHARRLVTGVLDALERLHAHGLVHRAIDPFNLYVADPDTERERLVILDVVARHPADQAVYEEGRKQSRTGWSRPGSWQSARYMFPHVSFDGPLPGPEADAFSLALVLVDLLAGRPLVETASGLGAFAALFQGTWDMPAEVDATPWGLTIRRALSPDRAQRFADAAQLAAALATG